MPLPDGTFINVFLATDPRLRVSRLGEFRGITLFVDGFAIFIGFAVPERRQV
jgi:hypothetical protein